MIALLSGNSRILLTVDERGSWEQLYYPYPGLHQQLHQARLGIYDEDSQRIAWLDEQETAPTEQVHLERSNACRSRLRLDGLEVVLDDMVHPDQDIVIRRITLRDGGGGRRRLRVFHYQSLKIGGSHHRETTYWDPDRNAIDHYKRSYHFRFLGIPTVDHFTCGEHTLKGLEGSHVDADDGMLQGNAVSHGSADSVLQWNVTLPEGGERVLHLFVLIGRSKQDVERVQAGVEGRDPALFTSEAVDYWNRWANDKRLQPSLDLSAHVRDVYRRSLFVVRDCAATSGAVIASPDAATLRSSGDGYEYCWWRDGAYICRAMSDTGQYRSAASFLRFAARCQEPEGHFLHRHFPDGYLGPTWHPPSLIQIDQTASVIDAVHHHYQRTGDLDELLADWEMVRRAADYLMAFVNDDGLPRASFDLWEERLATSAYSTGMVVRGLRAANQIGQALGKRSDFWAQASDRMRHAALQALWDPARSTLRKSVGPVDETIDASTLLVDIFPPGDTRYAQVVQAVERNLWQDGIGGVARYQGDQYFGHENPWIICTLWLAQARLRLGDTDRCRELIEWAAARAGPGGLLPEQVDSRTGERRGVIPLVWSHSTFLETVNAYTQHGRQTPQATVAVLPSAREAR